VQPFEPAARALRRDWGLEALDARQAQRWSESLGRSLVRERDREVQAYQEGRRPACCANEPELMVVGMDGGRWQSREKHEKTQSRWREDKVLTITTYLPGDGREQPPQPLVTSTVATARDAGAFGKMARVEAERRGLRQAEVVIAMGDGGNWIDPLVENHFRVSARIIDWCHASEHLWDCARALHGAQTPAAAMWGEKLEAWLWDGQVQKVIGWLAEHSRQLGEPQQTDGADHPRRVLAQNVGYFTKHQGHMDYPAYRARGWPIGSGVTEAAVKQFNKRVKGTEQFWNEQGIEPILALRGQWISQDDRWDRYWSHRPAHIP
jgi:hypothetical protein